jgi:hypothetical protein
MSSTISRQRKDVNMNALQASNRWAKGSIGLGLIVLCISLFTSAALQECYADSAEVLPQGKSGIFVEGKFYLPVTKQYDEEGNKEKVADKYNAIINGSVIPSLDTIGAAFGFPAGTANLGETDVSYKYNFQIIEFNYAYGITDRLSIGTKIPYWIVKNNVDASLDTTNANFGLNPNFGLAPPPLGAAPFVPIGPPPGGAGGVPLTTQQFQSLLGSGLTVNNTQIPGYGYKRVENWDKQGLSDIEAFLRYQYYKSENFRLAATGGVRMPTGWTDDPDSLVDYPSGTGAWAGLLRLNQDYIGTKDLFLSATLKYDYYFPDRNYERVPDSADQPLTTNKERVNRTYGPFFELELSGSYNLWKGLGPFAVYKFGYKWQNDISGDKGYDYSSLEEETNAMEHVYIVGLQYSTIPMYLKNEFPVPIVAFIGYRNRFAGENVLVSEYIDVGLTVYF